MGASGPTRPDGRGRPWRDRRNVLNGILWVMRTGAPWIDLPDGYPPYQTCHRRFQLWARNGALARILHRLARELAAAGHDFIEAFSDTTSAGAKISPCVGGDRNQPRRRTVDFD